MKKTLIVLASIVLSSVMLYAQESKNELNFAQLEQEKHNQSQQQYQFSVTYRLQVGYNQQYQNSQSDTYTYPIMHLYGAKLGVSFDFNLPYNFSIQTGLIYSLTYGENEQHWRNFSSETYEKQYINHRVLSHQLNVPVFATYRVKLWKDLSMVFYTGPQIAIGLAQKDYLQTYLNEATTQWLVDNNVPIEQYDRYSSGELYRTNVLYSLGGGLQWQNYRLTGGYNFGLNNLVKQDLGVKQLMNEWSVDVMFSYSF